MTDSHDAHDMQKAVRRYIIAGVALGIGTVLTVLVNYLHFDSMKMTITLALIVATAKGSLVAGFFMHLFSEKKLIYSILVATVFFLAGLMYLVVWSRNQMPQGSAHLGRPPVEHFGTAPSPH